MRDALRATGWRAYALFLRDDGLLREVFHLPEEK
jgi:hypothetical protein